MTRLAAILVLALMALPAGAAGVYKCTKADGSTYYSDQKCPSDAQAERLKVPRAARNDSEDNAGESAPTGKTLDERIAEATDPVLKAQLELRKKECELARTQLQRYENAPYLVEQQDDGSQRRLSDEEAEAQKQQLRDMLAGQCR